MLGWPVWRLAECGDEQCVVLLFAAQAAASQSSVVNAQSNTVACMA